MGSSIPGSPSTVSTTSVRISPRYRAAIARTSCYNQRVLWLLLAFATLLVAWMMRERLRRYRQTEAPREPDVSKHPEATHLEQDVRLLELLEPGGTPDNAIEVAASSVVEVHAAGIPCTLCEKEVDVEEHLVEEHKGQLLRVARVRCRRCGHHRSLYFRLAQPN
jgi:hypothetical protein